ncbi:MAG: signal peptidase II [Candidatus Velthaea sp.]
MILWVVAVVVFALDRWTKHLIVSSFLPMESKIVIPHLLWFTYVQNVHGAFGLFGSQPVLLIVLALIVLGLFLFAFRDATRHSMLARVAIGMITGGAFGNIGDRLVHPYVVDFIDFKTIWQYVFNVADSCVTIGVILLLLLALRREKTP